MEKYKVNGVEVEYDTFDLVNMEVYRDEVQRVAALADLAKDVTVENYIDIIREMCEGIMDAFDTIIGEGTSEKLFGGRVNAKIVPAAWAEFTQAVANMMNTDIPGAGSNMPVNREQRRAAERVARREAAKKRVEERGYAT